MGRRSRAEKRIREWAPYPRVLFAGDAHALIAELKDDSPSGDISVASLTGPIDPDALADIAVVAVTETGRSALAKAQDVLDAEAPRLAPGAVRVVLIVHGAARITKRLVAQLVSPEVLHQVVLAIQGAPSPSASSSSAPTPNAPSPAAPSPTAPIPQRSLRDRIGLTLLGAAGIDVLRMGSLPAAPADTA